MYAMCDADLQFAIYLIRRASYNIQEEKARDFLLGKADYFERTASQLNCPTNASLCLSETADLYDLVSNCHDAFASNEDNDCGLSDPFFMAAVASLRDMLGRAAR